MKPQGLSYLAEEARRHDYGRYVAALFVPEPARSGLFALYAFERETAHIADKVTEEMLGLIRLSWWRESLEALAAGGAAREHPVVLALQEVMRETPLDMALFESLLTQREHELRAEPFLDDVEFEAYIDGTSGAMFRLASSLLGEEASELCRHAGRAYGLYLVLKGMARGRYLVSQPLLATCGVEYQAVLEGDVPPALIRKLADRMEVELIKARCLKNGIPQKLRVIFLPLFLVDNFLRSLKRAQYNLFKVIEKQVSFIDLVRLFTRAFLGRY